MLVNARQAQNIPGAPRDLDVTATGTTSIHLDDPG